MIDPTARAQQHYYELEHKIPFTGNIQPSYQSVVDNTRYDISKMTFINYGLWDEKTSLRFYKQANEEYVSQSLIQGMFGISFDIVPVNTIQGIMTEYGHTHIDLLKLDIEGAECKVLNNMLDCHIYPTYVLIEFDLYLKGKDSHNETLHTIQRLQASGYKILYNESMNITFVREVQYIGH